MTMTSPQRRYVTRSQPRPKVETKLSKPQAVGPQPWSKEKVRSRSVVRTSPPTHRLYQEGAAFLAFQASDPRGQRRLAMPPITDDGTFIEFHNVVAARQQLVAKPLPSTPDRESVTRQDILVATLPASIDPEFEPITIPVPGKPVNARSNEPQIRIQATSGNVNVRELASTTRPVKVELPVIARRVVQQPTRNDKTEAVLVANPRPPKTAMRVQRRRSDVKPAPIDTATFDSWEWTTKTSAGHPRR